MQTTVVLHTSARPSYFRWLEAVETWCGGFGTGMSAEMVSLGAFQALRDANGRPSGAKQLAAKAGEDERWVWDYYPHTRIHYLIRDRRPTLRRRTRRVIVTEFQTTLPQSGS